MRPQPFCTIYRISMSEAAESVSSADKEDQEEVNTRNIAEIRGGGDGAFTLRQNGEYTKDGHKYRTSVRFLQPGRPTMGRGLFSHASEIY